MDVDMGYWIHITGCVALASGGDFDRAVRLAIDHCGEEAANHVREYWPLATRTLAVIPATIATAKTIDEDLAQRIPDRSAADVAAIATELLTSMPRRPPV